MSWLVLCLRASVARLVFKVQGMKMNNDTVGFQMWLGMISFVLLQMSWSERFQVLIELFGDCGSLL